MAVSSLHDLFLLTLQDVYYAEKKLLKALPKMAKNASSEELAEGLTEHLSETEGQVARLEQIFDMIGETPKAKKCDAIEGLVAEGEEIVEETDAGPVRDTGLIAAAQAVEHYEIARYGAMVAWAEEMGHDDVVSLLTETLEEEKAAEEKLTEVSNTINFEANSAEMKAAE
jgi:ferritin-like metal-binding protein YciE